MKQDKDWIEVMRSSLRDAELPPAQGGWERLERELGVVVPRRPAWKIYFPRIAAAAAVLLFAVVAGGLLLNEKGVGMDGNVIKPLADGSGIPADFMDSVVVDPELEARVATAYRREQEQRTAAVAQAVDIYRSSSDVEVRPAVGERLSVAEVVALKNPDPDLALAVSTDAGESAQEVAIEQATAPAKNSSPLSDSQAGVKSQRSAADRPLRSAGDAAVAQGGTVWLDPYADLADDNKSARRKGRRTQLGLFAGGAVTSSGETPGSQRFDMSDAVMPDGSNTIITQKYNYSDYSFKHHQPFSFGLSLRKEFSYGLSLESGLNYTLLFSDVRVKYGTEDISQKLHFIGVPLRVNWRFLERGRFSLYVGAGGMVEKCVVAKFGSKRVDEPGVQWSVTGAAGAQYRLGGLVGLYFEPEVSYYFTQTDLRTARTDSPLSLTLRAGVRLSF